LPVATSLLLLTILNDRFIHVFNPSRKRRPCGAN
jgi:hypothetical protein